MARICELANELFGACTSHEHGQSTVIHRITCRRSSTRLSRSAFTTNDGKSIFASQPWLARVCSGRAPMARQPTTTFASAHSPQPAPGRVSWPADTDWSAGKHLRHPAIKSATGQYSALHIFSIDRLTDEAQCRLCTTSPKLGSAGEPNLGTIPAFPGRHSAISAKAVVASAPTQEYLEQWE